MKLPIVVAIVLTATNASAAALPCSIHAKAGTAASALPALAKVSRADAEKTALAAVKAPAGATVVEGELEVEHGCVVHSFDIRIPGTAGVEEVLVDAGTGKVLTHEHEDARREAAEKAKDEASRKDRHRGATVHRGVHPHRGDATTTPPN